MGDRALHVAARGDPLLAVEDGRGVLHAAEAGRALDVGQLLVGVGADQVGEEVDHLGGAPEDAGGVAGVPGVDPVGDARATVAAGGDGGVVARGQPHLADGEVRAADDHGVAGDGHGGGPAPGAPAVRATQGVVAGGGGGCRDGAVGDHLPGGGGVDGVFHGRLVAWMVDRREPEARPVGPVVGEGRRVAVHVVAQDQAVVGGAAVGHGHLHRAGRVRGREDAQLAVRVLERGANAVNLDGVDGQPDQVELHGRVGVGGRRDHDARPGGDVPPVLVKRQLEVVVQHVEGARVLAGERGAAGCHGLRLGRAHDRPGLEGNVRCERGGGGIGRRWAGRGAGAGQDHDQRGRRGEREGRAERKHRGRREGLETGRRSEIHADVLQEAVWGQTPGGLRGMMRSGPISAKVPGAANRRPGPMIRMPQRIR